MLFTVVLQGSLNNFKLGESTPVVDHNFSFNVLSTKLDDLERCVMNLLFCPLRRPLHSIPTVLHFVSTLLGSH